MGFFKKKSVRAAALVTAFALFCSAVYVFLGGSVKECRLQEASEKIYLNSDEAYDEMQKIADWAWYCTSMYMKYQELEDDSFLKKSLQKEMQKLGITDDTGKLILPESKNFYYRLDSGGQQYTGSEKEPEENSEYLYEFNVDINGIHTERTPSFLVPSFDPEARFYTNNSGMYYYYYRGKGTAVYDYDTEGLKSYVDELGADVYLNEDGTSPIPYIYNDKRDLYKSTDDENSMYSVEEMNIYSWKTAELTMVPVQEHIDEFEQFMEGATEIRHRITAENITLCILLIAAAGILSLYVVIMGGYDEREGRFRLRFQDRRFGEVYLLIIAAALILAVNLYYYDISTVTEAFLREGFSETAVKTGGTAIAGILYLILVFSVDSLLNRLKCRNIKDTFLITETAGKVCGRIKDKIITFEMMRNDAFTKRFLLRILFAVAAGFTAAVITLFTESILFFVAAAVIIVVVYTFSGLKDLEALNKLYENIARISEGDYTPCIDDRGSVTYSATTKLNRISDGIQNAVDEQLKSERMKIELVTNVSHDLKTPLTSVISYVDLLSREELPPEARDYVSVLEQKTARLKNIVSDVFDLAKATSSTDVNVERIDAVILVRQVLADMEETSRKYEREIKTDIGAESAFIMAEGKKMYRVIQNLIDNALKYSMNGTRIYLKLRAENGKVCINIKNTAAYEMTFTPEEITERFTRGDKSRTTEGSGLGLSIAKSFTEACGGSFSVSTDGDVFAANIEFDMV